MLHLSAMFELSSAAPGGDLPRIQQVKSELGATVPLGKTTQLITLDDPTGDRHYEIDVTITKL